MGRLLRYDDLKFQRANALKNMIKRIKHALKIKRGHCNIFFYNSLINVRKSSKFQPKISITAWVMNFYWCYEEEIGAGKIVNGLKLQ